MQLDLFDIMYDDFRFDKPIKTLTLFSGIGFQEMGMDLAEIPYEMVGTSEIDKFAILSYAAIHTDYSKIRNDYNFPRKEEMVEYLQERNVGINLKTQKQTITNSTNIEKVKDFYLACVLSKNFGDVSRLKGKDIESEVDLLTYSFPCQDLSKAGKQKGMGEGSRSGLVYEVLRLLYELKETNNLPKVLIMENVIDLIQKKFVDEWNKIALEIKQMGYTNFTQELNGKNYGIAQNRRRVFMVSVLGDYNYNFPRKVDLKYRLKDYLEEEVDEKYYLSDKMTNFFTENSKKNEEKGNGFRFRPTNGDTVAKCITTRSGSRMDDNFIKIPEATNQGDAIEEPRLIGGIGKKNFGKQFRQGNRVYDADAIAMCLLAQPVGNAGGNSYLYAVKEPSILTPKRTEYGKSIRKDYESGNIKESRHNMTELQPREDGIINTITTVQKDNLLLDNRHGMRIRKLTPKETGRLMGMQDYQIDKQREVTSNAQMYKQHGNGIIAQIMALIIGMM